MASETARTVQTHPVPLTVTSSITLQHALVVPLLLCAGALYLHGSGLDERISAQVFDAARGRFPAHEWALLDLVGHRIAKSAMWAVGLVVLTAAIASHFSAGLRRHSVLLWITLAAMAAGPLLVTLLKDMNGIQCPWNLAQFGGPAVHSHGWFVPRAEVTRCFPSGHAAGGVAPLAFYFAGFVSSNLRLQWLGLAAALVCGVLFSAVRVAQGAHFLSHNLWSAAIDWAMCAALFATYVRLQRRAPRHSTVLAG